MAKEFHIRFAPGSGGPPYGTIIADGNYMWNGAAMVPTAAGCWPGGAVALAQTPGTNDWAGDMPATVPPGTYTLAYQQQAGSAPAGTDAGIGSDTGPLVWTGSPVGPSQPLTPTAQFRFQITDDTTKQPVDRPGPALFAPPGAVRADTGEVVVQPGTPFQHVGVGLWSYTLSPAVAGATYGYWVQLGDSVPSFKLEVHVPPAVSGAVSNAPDGWRYLRPPAVEPVSYADVKAQLRIDADDEQAYLNSLIVAARLYAENDMQRTLVARQIAYTFDQHRCDRMGVKLPRGPVLSIDSVTTRGGSPLATSAWHLRNIGDTTYINVDHAGDGVTVTYTAGYGPASTDVPQDIRTGILLHVAHLWENRSASTTRPQSHIAMGLDCIYGQHRIGGLIG